VKLIGIDGSVMYEKLMTPIIVDNSDSSSSTVASDSTESTGSLELPITTSDVFIQSGEVSDSSINIMARCNNEAGSTMKLWLDGAEMDSTDVNASTDFTHTFLVDGLSSRTKYSYQVQCIVADGTALDSMEGSFTTAPGGDDEVEVSFVWAADLAGQGYGRNPNFSVTNANGETVTGGYIVFDTMEALSPDFALFQGDLIYADGAIPAAINYTNGTEVLGTWVNNPSKDFVAVTLDEFRANWKYNHGDDKMQSFLAKTPIFVQWDDHEVTNNWYPTEVLVNSPLYEGNVSADELYNRSLQALIEFNPIESEFTYRSQRFGKHLEIFFPDFRSYRDPNPDNSNPTLTDMMGPEQVAWLKDGLKSSSATWKIISAHDPLGVVTGSEGDYDSFGNEDPAILGRELELQELLAFINDNGIENVVSLTSDVHFTAHVNLSPDRAEGGFTDFKPLDEFVIGPIHAGSFGPNYMDTSFGAQYEYEMGPLSLGYERWANLAPEVNELQSFGHASVSETGELHVKLIGIDGSVMHEKILSPVVLNDSANEESTSSGCVVVVSCPLGLFSLFVMMMF